MTRKSKVTPSSMSWLPSWLWNYNIMKFILQISYNKIISHNICFKPGKDHGQPYKANFKSIYSIIILEVKLHYTLTRDY